MMIVSRTIFNGFPPLRLVLFSFLIVRYFLYTLSFSFQISLSVGVFFWRISPGFLWRCFVDHCS